MGWIGQLPFRCFGEMWLKSATIFLFIFCPYSRTQLMCPLPLSVRHPLPVTHLLNGALRLYSLTRKNGKHRPTSASRASDHAPTVIGHCLENRVITLTTTATQRKHIYLDANAFRHTNQIWPLWVGLKHRIWKTNGKSPPTLRLSPPSPSPCSAEQPPAGHGALKLPRECPYPRIRSQLARISHLGFSCYDLDY